MNKDRAEQYERIKHALVTTRDTAALTALVGRAPFLLDEHFLATAEHWAANADQAGGFDLAEGLRERIQALRELKGA